ncbi:MAG: transposase [Terriglobales bacterium]
MRNPLPRGLKGTNPIPSSSSVGITSASGTSGRYKHLAIHMHEPARQRARDLSSTPAFASAQRERKKVEALFAELKNLIELRRLRLRRMKFVREQFFLAAAAQNLKRLVRFLSQPKAPIVEATA